MAKEIPHEGGSGDKSKRLERDYQRKAKARSAKRDDQTRKDREDKFSDTNKRKLRKARAAQSLKKFMDDN